MLSTFVGRGGLDSRRKPVLPLQSTRVGESLPDGRDARARKTGTAHFLTLRDNLPKSAQFATTTCPGCHGSTALGLPQNRRYQAGNRVFGGLDARLVSQFA